MISPFQAETIWSNKWYLSHYPWCVIKVLQGGICLITISSFTLKLLMAEILHHHIKPARIMVYCIYMLVGGFNPCERKAKWELFPNTSENKGILYSFQTMRNLRPTEAHTPFLFLGIALSLDPAVRCPAVLDRCPPAA